MTIDDLIREAAVAGPFNLTVFKTTTGFQASFSPDKVGWRVEQDADPVAAIKAALGEKRTPPAPEMDLFG